MARRCRASTATTSGPRWSATPTSAVSRCVSGAFRSGSGLAYGLRWHRCLRRLSYSPGPRWVHTVRNGAEDLPRDEALRQNRGPNARRQAVLADGRQLPVKFGGRGKAKPGVVLGGPQPCSGSEGSGRRRVGEGSYR